MTGTDGAVVYRDGGAGDAIAEYSRRLVAALGPAGTSATYEPGGLAPLVRRSGPPPPWILLQYNPNSWGRRGVAPGLVRDVFTLRRRGESRLVLCVHEPWTHVWDWRSVLMAAWQRAQLRPLVAAADAVIGVTPVLADRLGPSASHVGVGTNVTPGPVDRTAARRALGLADGLVVALFGSKHPSRAFDHVESAVAALGARTGGAPPVVLNLGMDPPHIASPGRVTVRTPGALLEEELSLHLSAADLALLPFADGVSVRRTTMMAALAHGLPVAGLHGSQTDGRLRNRPDALALSPVGRPDLYASMVVALVEDPDRMRAMGTAGRNLYETEFDWPVIARRISRIVGTDGPRLSASSEGPSIRRSRRTGVDIRSS